VSTETETQHFLVRAKIRVKFMRSEKGKKVKYINGISVNYVRKRKKKNSIKEVIANVQNTQSDEADDINEIWNKIKKGINEAAGRIIGKEERPQINKF
jgi:hypothetical protein